MLKVKKFQSDAILPRKMRSGDAGFDLYSNENIIILGFGKCSGYGFLPENNWALVSTDVGITVPDGTYGRIAPRSGVSMKGLSVNAGVVDKNYTGILKVLLVNHSASNYSIKKGDRIAQLILERIVDDCEVVEVDELDETTSRGTSGFGSSGV